MKIWTSFGIALLAILPFVSAQETVTLTCNLSQCYEKPNLYYFNGVGFELFQAPQASSDSVLRFRVPRTEEPRFYYIGLGTAMRPLLLGTEKEVTMTGNCPGIALAKIVDSPVNEAYGQLKQDLNDFKQRTGTNIQRYRRAGNDEVEKAKVVEEMRILDAEKIAYLEKVKKAQPYMAKIADLETYVSYDGNANKDKFLNEIDYFANQFFQFVDFTDKTYEQLPWVYESFKGYTSTLLGVGLSDGALKKYLEKSLLPIPEGSRTRLLAMSGMIVALKQRQNSNFVPFAEAFIEEFRELMPAATADLQAQLEGVKGFSVGGTAPDFTQSTPEGTELKLSDLRGKVLLLDFWASWCGPCRRENPNVVKLYDRYKDKGFEILGVSLDKDRDRWLQAIEADKLTWHHVSDLQGWNNTVAQQYNVRSIPFTMLLDAEGKVIALNLRGAALEKQLSALFGEN